MKQFYFYMFDVILLFYISYLAEQILTHQMLWLNAKDFLSSEQFTVSKILVTYAIERGFRC
jgi:hypothetical protein